MNSFNDERNKFLKCTKKLIMHNDISFVLNNLEALIILPPPLKNRNVSASQHAANKKFSIISIDNAEEAFKSFEKELELRESTFSQIRRIYPNFCVTMKNKVSNKDFKDYHKYMRKIIDDICKIMDNHSFNENRYTNYKELLLVKKDFISSIIDSEISCRVSNIQDNFVLNELNNIDILKFNEDTRKNIEIIRNELQRRLDEQNLFYKLYNTKNKIKLEGRGIDE